MESRQSFGRKQESEVPTASGAQDRRKGDRHKKHFCLFCRKEFKRIYMHLSRQHLKEVRVQKIMSMEDSARKRWAWKKLAQEGDYIFNTSNLGDKNSRPITVKKPDSITENRRYCTCSNCLGRIRTSYRRYHEKICSTFLEKEKEKTQELHLFHRSIVDGLNEDVVKKFAGNKTLYKFIQGLWEEKGTRNRRTIREKMKIILVLEEKLQTETGTKKQFKFFFKPKYVDNFIKAINELSGIQIRNNEIFLDVPTKAQRLCRISEQFGNFLEVYYIKKEKIEKKEEVTRFLLVFKSESERKIRNLAENTLRTKKIETPVELPKATEIGRLIQYLKNETKDLLQKIKNQRDEKTWRNLAENILLRLTIFNRRRGGAVEKIKLEDFRKTGNVNENLTEEFIYNLKEEEKNFLENLKIIEIKHKCNNIISVYIDAELRSAIETLIEFRKEGKISEENSYVFAAGKGSVNPIRCVDVLGKYRKIFPPDLRKTLTATNLRKQGATAAQILNLTEQDLEEWANHMGHSAQVHKRYYRFKEKPNLILKTGRILSALDQGTLKHYKGRNLEEIPLVEENSVTDFKNRKECRSLSERLVESTKRKSRPKKLKTESGKGVQNKTRRRNNQRKK